MASRRDKYESAHSLNAMKIKKPFYVILIFDYRLHIEAFKLKMAQNSLA